MKFWVLTFLLLNVQSANAAGLCKDVYARAQKSSNVYSADAQLVEKLLSQGEALLAQLFPEGRWRSAFDLARQLESQFPIDSPTHGTSVEAIYNTLLNGGHFKGSANIEKTIWGRSEDFTSSESLPQDVGPFYFYRSQSTELTEGKLVRRNSWVSETYFYASTLAESHFRMSRMGIKSTDFTHARKIIDNYFEDHYPNGESFSSYLHEVKRSPRLFKHLNQRMVEQLSQELEANTIRDLNQNEVHEASLQSGVLLIFNPTVTTRLKAHRDPDEGPAISGSLALDGPQATGPQFFLLGSGRPQLTIRDLTAIIPLSQKDASSLREKLTR